MPPLAARIQMSFPYETAERDAAMNLPYTSGASMPISPSIK
jgi:hypothetical protein